MNYLQIKNTPSSCPLPTALTKPVLILLTVMIYMVQQMKGVTFLISCTLAAYI